jgi:hypothetical protein
LCERLLGIEDVRVDDDFFAIGGQSLLAVAFLSQVNDLLGVDVPLEVFLAEPTVERLAARIRLQQGGAEPPDEPVCVAPEGARSPLFFLSPGAEVLRIRHLRHHALDRPVYAMSGLGAVGDVDDRPRPLAEIAEAHVRQILDVQPHGPFALAGFSIAGLTALEVARQLRAAKNEVPIVVGVHATPSVRRTYAPSLGKPDGQVVADFTREDLERVYERWIRYVAAARDHEAPPYPGRVTVVYDSSWTASFLRERWERLVTGPLRLVATRADHDSVLGSAELGDVLERELASVP